MKKTVVLSLVICTISSLFSSQEPTKLSSSGQLHKSSDAIAIKEVLKPRNVSFGGSADDNHCYPWVGALGKRVCGKSNNNNPKL